ncbi:MAG: MFS transporter [Anaerolineae bacterium]
MTVHEQAAALPLPTDERLTLWQKIGYGLGDIYGGGAGLLISTYYGVFLTDVVRIRPELAGTVILISKIYDSITDPFEGLLADRTRTRLGRRRPYLLAGILLVFLSFFMLFYPVTFSREAARFAFVVTAYLFYSTVVSIVTLNYNALQSELTLDYDERTRLSSFRIFFSTVSSLVCAVLPPEIVGMFPDVRTGYIVMALAFGAFFALPFIATVIATRERPEFQKPPRPFDWREAFIEPFRMRAFLYVLGMYLFAFVAIDAVLNTVVFYMKNYLGRGDDANIVLGVLLIAQVISLPFYTWLSRRTSKRVGYITGAVLWMAVMLLSLLVAPGQPAWVIFVLGALIGVGTGGVVVMVYAIFPDIPDVDELRSGERREGIYSALFTFMRKLASALAVFAVLQVIGLAGYIPPLEVTIEGGTQLVEQPQTAGFVLALRLIFALLPVVFAGLGLIFALRYPLSHEVHQRLNEVLAARRAGVPESEGLQAEAAGLEAVLFGGEKSRR